MVFQEYQDKQFEKGLELGCGDGFQSQLLQKYIKNLICTDYKLKVRYPSGQIQYIELDAELIDRKFREDEFDLIFSSNMMEHLPDPLGSMNRMLKCLKPGGVMIHIMPNTAWKIGYLICFYPRLLASIWNKIWNKLSTRKTGLAPGNERHTSEETTNNPKHNASYGKMRRKLWPTPHGAYKSNWEELRKYRKKVWLTRMNKSGIHPTKCIKGPFVVGCFPDSLNRLLTNLGLCSEWAYIIHKDK